MAKVEWRDETFDARTADMLAEADVLVGPDIPVHPTQGSYSDGSQSANTHKGGGAVDLSVINPRRLSEAEILKIVRCLRLVGFAAWYRTKPEWSGDPHIHAIAVGCPDLDPAAAAQVLDLKRGLNGLANHLPDRHKDMHLPVITWEQYKASKKAKEDDMPSASEIAWAVWNYDRIPHNKTGSLVNATNPVDKDNPTWRAGSTVEDTENRVRVLEKLVRDLHLKVDALIGALTDDGK